MAAAFEVRQLPGRGQGLVAARDLEPGEEVLCDTPLLLTAAPEARSAVCAACLRVLGAGAQQCGECQQAAFCSLTCAAAARTQPEVHSPYVCRLLAQASVAQLSSEEAAAVAFLVQVSALREAAMADSGAAARLAALTSLAAGLPADVAPPPTTAAAHAALAAAAGGAPPLTLQEAGRLLALEQRVSYGVMAPSSEQGERRVRGGGIYPTASLLNHECLPNVARFDDFDGAAAAPASAVVRFRTLHAVPRGEELTQSYFPLVWDYEERSAACAEQYGFTCTCPRCQVEAAWERGIDARSDGGRDGGDAAAAPDRGAGQQATGAGGCTDEYIQLFLLKYVCSRPGCFGTLAPLPGGADGASQCNMCGHTRTEAEFMAEVQAYS